MPIHPEIGTNANLGTLVFHSGAAVC